MRPWQRFLQAVRWWWGRHGPAWRPGRALPGGAGPARAAPAGGPVQRVVPCPVCKSPLGTVEALTRQMGEHRLTCARCGRQVNLQVLDHGWMVSLPQR